MSRRLMAIWFCQTGQNPCKLLPSSSASIPQPRLTLSAQNKRTFISTPSTHSAVAAELSSSSSCSSPQEDHRKWQIFASVILERPPIIGKEKTRLEQEFQTMLDDYEHEKASKSDHELRIEQDIRNMEKKRKGLEVVNEPLQTGFEYEEDREKLINSFSPASRVTDSDDLSSLNRLLDEKLYLFLPHFLGPSDVWFLPTSSVEGKSSMREAADDALAKTLGVKKALQVKVLGNAPVGFYKYRYPLKSEESQTFTGGKFFFFKAFIKDPRTFRMEENGKRAWFSKAEMKSHLQRRYRTKISGCLFDH